MDRILKAAHSEETTALSLLIDALSIAPLLGALYLAAILFA